MKLVYAEAESAVLERYLANATTLIASEIALIELHRVALRQNVDGARAAMDDAERRVSWVALDASIAQAAGVLEPATLRTLDAIHVATALSIRDDLEALVTYDRRMIEAADHHRLPVASPGLATA